mgnify:CR=1 FL=1
MCQQKRKDKCIRDIRKNASGVEEVEKELKEEKIEAISGGLGDFEGLPMGELIGEPIKENVKRQTELTESMLDFMNHSKFHIKNGEQIEMVKQLLESNDSCIRLCIHKL